MDNAPKLGTKAQLDKNSGNGAEGRRDGGSGYADREEEAVRRGY